MGIEEPSFEKPNNQEKTNSGKKEESAREFFEREFEEKMGFLASDLSEEKLEETKKQWVDEKMEEAKDIEGLNQITENKIEEEIVSRKDQLSGLKRREEMYKKMNKIVEKKLNADREKLNEEEWLKVFENIDVDDLKDDDRVFFISDISYLNLVNKIGDSKGDKLISDAGEAFHSVGVEGYRPGGDEFAALPEKEKDMEEKFNKIKENFKKQSISNLLKNRFGLEPNIDVGTSHFSEAVEVFKKMLENEENKQEILKKKPVKYFNDLWRSIADKRMNINKAIQRIPILMDKYENDSETYKDIITFLRKGAYAISNEELEELIQKDVDHEDIKNFVLEKQSEKIKSLNPESDEEVGERVEKRKEKAIWDLVYKTEQN